MLNVFITVDTEFYPLNKNWRRQGIESDVNRDIYGHTKAGKYGLDYQIDTLRQFGLKAVFFVESLCASVPSIGPSPLKEIVRHIIENGHDVQLHLHPEWLPYIPQLADKSQREHIRLYSEEDQHTILCLAIDNLVAAGAPRPRAFRAGDFAADLGTVRALRRLGIEFDSSYNAAYLSTTCGLRQDHLLTQPEDIEGVHEFPVSCFVDYPGHFRHAELCACSSAELKNMLAAAEQSGWSHFVILSHTFEMLRNRRHLNRPVSVRRVVVDRFERLCRFLAENREQYRTGTFAEMQLPFVCHTKGHPNIYSNPFRTVLRICEQVRDRLPYRDGPWPKPGAIVR